MMGLLIPGHGTVHVQAMVGRKVLLVRVCGLHLEREGRDGDESSQSLQSGHTKSEHRRMLLHASENLNSKSCTLVSLTTAVLMRAGGMAQCLRVLKMHL